MKIIIAGAGEVGFHLAKLLSYESQEIVLIDNNKENLKYAENHLDIRTIKGKISNPRVLLKAGANKSDILLAVTRNDEKNMVACKVASIFFNIPS